MSRSAPLGAPSEARHVLAISPFRRLWISLSLSSLGDWLSLLALMSLAAIFTADGSRMVQYLAVSGVVVIKLAPPILLSPLAGVVADRLDRRWTMVIGDILRGLLYVSIPLVGLAFPGFALEWLLIANLLAEIVALFWAPAKDATVPNLVPKKFLEQANQISLLTTYGTAPVAALLFAALASASNVLGALVPSMASPEADVALYLNGVTFFIAAIVIVGLPIPKHKSPAETGDTSDSGILRAVFTGWRYLGGTPLVRGLVLGLLGAFAAGGAVVGVSRIHVEHLGAGNAGFAVVFAAVFAGMALGMLAGPRVLKKFSRRRLFGLSLTVSGLALLLAGAVPDMVFTAVLTGVLGMGAGIAWVIGLTMLGHEVEDAYRGRVFAFVHGAARVVLVASTALAPLAAGLIGDYSFPVGALTYDLYGSGAVLMASGLLAAIVALVCYGQMNKGASDSGHGLLPELSAALRGVDLADEDEQQQERPSGVFIVVEGGEGSGKSTQVRELTVWLRDQGFEVLGTRQPGATKLGMRLRGLLLDRENSHITPRAEVLLYAADKADHIDQEILPALRRGAVVISDRYVDSMLAYQGVGRDLDPEEIREIADWSTRGVVPDLTVLLDVAPEDGLARLGRPADRIEAESLEFHKRVRQGFLSLARTDPDRYLVLDGGEPQDKVGREIRRRVRSLLPDPVPSSSEAVTGMIPVIRND
ncbi:dTMP kinase [Nocardiopsis sp. CNT312]|uniref:dTMP kinase n=1 Tax=Nocardiopsis sp. CNT312 TaxID=1137268 RepID=UPI00048F8622|nr:dTMP kinase [Nocardiopsis sp. CNT312]